MSTGTELLHFQIESPENFVRMAASIMFDKNPIDVERFGSAWYDIFNDDKGDELFHIFMQEVLPNGGTIDVPQIAAIKARALLYLENSVEGLEAQARRDKVRYDSWVYFKPHHKVYPVGFAKHEDKVKELLIEYFDDLDEYDSTAFRRFIRENFEIRSANTDMDKIVADAAYLHRCVYLGE